MQPALGRIVRYFASELEMGRADMLGRDREHPAIVTRVHSPECLNLMVCIDGHGTAPRVKVMSKATAKVGVASWAWPETAAPAVAPDDLPAAISSLVARLNMLGNEISTLPFHPSRTRAVLTIDDAVGALRESLRL